MKVSIIGVHFRTFRWTAIMAYHFRKFPMSVDSELIIVDNNPGHPSIKAITETELGEGVRVIEGRSDFPSHGYGYNIGTEASTGDWLFMTETDAYPIRANWFEPWRIASENHDLIGPEVPQSSGRYVHPAGALLRREWYDKAKEWQAAHKDWVFIPGVGISFGYDHPYHVVAHQYVAEHRRMDHPDEMAAIDLWRNVGPWQEMRSFDEDNWDTYPQRTGIQNFDTVGDQHLYCKIGYEPGQWLAYFVESHGGRVMRAPTQLQWIKGHEGKQAHHMDVFGGFRHIWAGTSTVVSDNFAAAVKKTKLNQLATWYANIPANIRADIEALEKRYGQNPTL